MTKVKDLKELEYNVKDEEDLKVNTYLALIMLHSLEHSINELQNKQEPLKKILKDCKTENETNDFLQSVMDDLDKMIFDLQALFKFLKLNRDELKRIKGDYRRQILDYFIEKNDEIATMIMPGYIS